MSATPRTAAGTPRNTPSPARAGKNGKKGKKTQLVEEPDCDKPTPVSFACASSFVFVYHEVESFQ